MVKLNGKLLEKDKADLDKQWQNLIKNANQGILDREMAVYLMERLNAIDNFLIHQGIFK